MKQPGSGRERPVGDTVHDETPQVTALADAKAQDNLWLYVTIVRALGAQPRYLKAELMAQAGDLLAAETAERHRRVVLICDLCRARNYADSRGWPGRDALPGRAS